MKTKVIFRKFILGDVIALFPELPTGQSNRFCDGEQMISSYMHVGQHGDASPRLIDSLSPATAAEYSDLKDELVSLGYELEVQS